MSYLLQKLSPTPSSRNWGPPQASIKVCFLTVPQALALYLPPCNHELLAEKDRSWLISASPEQKLSRCPLNWPIAESVFVKRNYLARMDPWHISPSLSISKCITFSVFSIASPTPGLRGWWIYLRGCPAPAWFCLLILVRLRSVTQLWISAFTSPSLSSLTSDLSATEMLFFPSLCLVHAILIICLPFWKPLNLFHDSMEGFRKRAITPKERACPATSTVPDTL